MFSSLMIKFGDKRLIRLQRLDPMQPMDLGDGPELLGLEVTIPRGEPEAEWCPLFGAQPFYTGYLFDGTTRRRVFIKWARSKKRMEELKKEGNFYCSALRKLQGVVVPNFHGYYAAAGPGMRRIGCMILDEMDGVWGIDKCSRLEAAYSLHKFGVRHSGLSKEENFVLRGDKVYIIDFSEAVARCGCQMTKDRVKLCPELRRLEKQFGDGGTNKVLKEIGVPSGWRLGL